MKKKAMLALGLALFGLVFLKPIIYANEGEEATTNIKMCIFIGWKIME